MKLQSKLITLPLVVMIVFSQLACDASAYRKAAKASDDIALSLKALQSTVVDLYTADAIDANAARGMSRAIKNATIADDEFIAKIKTLGGKVDEASKPTVVQWVGELSASIATLNAQEAIYIKNPEAKLKLDLTLKTIQAALTIIQTTIGGAK